MVRIPPMKRDVIRYLREVEYRPQRILEATLASGADVAEGEKLISHIREVGKNFIETLAKIMLTRRRWASGVHWLQWGPHKFMTAAPSHHEVTLINLMSAFESCFPLGKPPMAYLHKQEVRELVKGGARGWCSRNINQSFLDRSEDRLARSAVFYNLTLFVF